MSHTKIKTCASVRVGKGCVPCEIYIKRERVNDMCVRERGSIRNKSLWRECKYGKIECTCWREDLC